MPALARAQSKNHGADKTYTFTLPLQGPSPLDHLDALFEAGCDDAIFGERDGAFFAEFDRRSNSLDDAVGSAIAQVESAIPLLRVVRMKPDGMTR